MLTVGLDVHFRKSSLCILDDNGKMLRELQVQGHWDKVVEELGRIKDPFQICYEASLGYGHLYEQIGKLPKAKKTVVAHPGQLRLIFRSRKKHDRVDAQKIAKLLYLDQVPPVYVPRQEVRSWRGLIEWRQKLLGRGVMVKNQIRSLLKGCGIVPLKGPQLFTKKGIAWLLQQTFPTVHEALRRDMLADELQEHKQRMRRVEEALAKIAEGHAGMAILQSIPGVGPRTAEAFLAYVDDPKRFGYSRDVGSYFGLVPCQDASADKNRLGHITREGPATVRKLLTEAAWQGTLRSARIRSHFEKVKGGDVCKRKIALVATARWLCVVMLAMLKTGECWRKESPVSQATPATPGTQPSPSTESTAAAGV
jgi:transposase